MGRRESLRRRGRGRNAVPPTPHPPPAQKARVTLRGPPRGAGEPRPAGTHRGPAGRPQSPPPGPPAGPPPALLLPPAPRQGLAGAASVSPAVSAGWGGGQAGGDPGRRREGGLHAVGPAGRSRRPPGRDPLIRFSQYIVRFSFGKVNRAGEQSGGRPARDSLTPGSRPLFALNGANPPPAAANWGACRRQGCRRGPQTPAPARAWTRSPTRTPTPDLAPPARTRTRGPGSPWKSDPHPDAD